MRRLLESHGAAGLLRCALVCLAAGCALPLACMAGVLSAQVDWEIDGDAFDFPVAIDAGVEPAVETTVRDRLAEQWKLVDWQPTPGAVGGSGAPGLRWVVLLAIEPHSVRDAAGGVHQGVNVFVKHRVETGATAVALALSPEAEKLYDYRETPPGPGEALTFIDDLRGRLETQLRTLGDSFEFRQQMRGISLVDRVISDDQRHRIVIPVRYEDLGADLDSKLRVELSGDALPNRTGRLDVKITGPVLDDPNLQGFVVGPVVDVVPLEADGQPVQLPRDWHQHFKNLIENAGTVSVNLLEYFPAPEAASDGIEPVPDR